VGSKAGADAEDDPVRRIGALVADMVEDGDCLQLGIGAIPDAVLASVSSRRDLGVHSGMISDGVLDLIRQGAITGARKTIDRHHVVTGFLLGSAELYAWARQAPQLRLRPVSYTHDAGVLARLDRLVSINSAVEIDLLGQVNSERLGGRAISGVGGQIDFLRAASVSRGGRSILALPSTARGGQVSRIVGHIPAAAVVTTCRTDVDLVVTEWGVASLRGATERERAERLIEVAAPEFREQLRATLEAS
jgi:4-hydroxybutyrate CoA-transferase